LSTKILSLTSARAVAFVNRRHEKDMAAKRKTMKPDTMFKRTDSEGLSRTDGLAIGCDVDSAPLWATAPTTYPLRSGRASSRRPASFPPDDRTSDTIAVG
jgi:hypothetical protein